jgi:flavin reductase (DIM6/NTAB) family NADH-FMN oxidoreductase RutF
MSPAVANSSEQHPSRSYRDCVGTFPTGVTVVTSSFEGRTAGMTLNSFISVSLNPLLILVSLAHSTRTLEVVSQSRKFTVSILHRGQREIALAFAAAAAAFPREHVNFEDDGHAPVREALATLCCRVVDVMRAGDHDLVLGEVERFDRRDGEPLVFHRGMFGGLDADALAPRGQLAGTEEPRPTGTSNLHSVPSGQEPPAAGTT